MNKVFLIGRLTKNPELRTTQSGKSNTTFSLAVNRNYKDENGNNIADFINCTVWNKTAEIIAKYCKKGSQVAIEGNIQTRKYENQMKETRYLTEINVEKVTLLDSKNKDINSMSNSEVIQSVINDEPLNNQSVNDPFENENFIELSDDDLPF